MPILCLHIPCIDSHNRVFYPSFLVFLPRYNQFNNDDTLDCVGSYHNVWSFLGMHDVMWEVKSLFKSAVIFQSLAAARNFYPQDERTCLRVSLADLHIAQVSHPVKLRLSLAGVGRRLEVERRRRDHASAPFQFIHTNWLAWPAAVATLFSSSIMLSSAMTMSLQPLLSSWENHGIRVLPRPVLPVWVAPMSSLMWKLAACTALAADHLVLVLISDCTWRHPLILEASCWT